VQRGTQVRGDSCGPAAFRAARAVVDKTVRFLFFIDRLMLT
jgi:hypothetical protein